MNLQKLEALAYRSMLSGALNFEKGQWEACLEEYSTSRLIYSALDTSQRGDVYKELVSTVVDPNIRYAAYKCNLSRSKAVQDIVLEALAPVDAELKANVESIDPEACKTTAEIRAIHRSKEPSRQDIPSTITWSSRTLSLDDASIANAVAGAVLQEEKLESMFKENGVETGIPGLISAYEEVIVARQEAVDATKTVIEELFTAEVETSDPRMQSLQAILTALSFALIEWQVGRNRILCGPTDGMDLSPQVPKTSKNQHKSGASQVLKQESSNKKNARIRQRVLKYDSTLQSIDSIEELKGVAGDAEFLNQIKGARVYYTSLK
ncbi:MAG: hypothetical protein Q9227_001617 [Pyrenula ochraceoflavens]